MSLDSWNYAPDVAEDNLGDMDYMELRDTGTESYTPGDSSATRIFMVRWDRREDFLADLLGYSAINSTGNGINRTIPDEHPDLDLFFAMTAQVTKGLGVLSEQPNNAASFTNAVITTEYKPRPYAVLPDTAITTELDRYVERPMTVAANFLTLQGTMEFVSAPSGVIIQNPPNKLSSQINFQYIWHEVPADPNHPFIPPNFTAMNNCLGRVNSVTFDADVLNAPAETVLFLGYEPKLVPPRFSATQTDMLYTWEITLMLGYMNNGTGLDGHTAGWNHIYRIDQNGWDLVTTNGTSGGNEIYLNADLNTIFTITN